MNGRITPYLIINSSCSPQHKLLKVNVVISNDLVNFNNVFITPCSKKYKWNSCDTDKQDNACDISHRTLASYYNPTLLNISIPPNRIISFCKSDVSHKFAKENTLFIIKYYWYLLLLVNHYVEHIIQFILMHFIELMKVCFLLIKKMMKKQFVDI